LQGYDTPYPGPARQFKKTEEECVRIGVTILSLMLLVGLSLATQAAATDAAAHNGVCSSLLCTARVDVSDRCPSNSDPAGDATTGQTAIDLLNLVWVDSTAAPSPGRYWCPGTGLCRDTLWFLGCRMSAQVSTRSITTYDVASGTWATSGFTLLTPRRAGGGGRIGNKIYIAGGRDSLVHLEHVHALPGDLHVREGAQHGPRAAAAAHGNHEAAARGHRQPRVGCDDCSSRFGRCTGIVQHLNLHQR
jgi:hypothetical protein